MVMRINEFIIETVSRAETIADLRSRAEQVAQYCDTIAEIPLMFREFRTGINYETLIARVDNLLADGAKRSPVYVKKGASGKAQTEILEMLGIENPVFVVMSPPVSTFGFHGDPHIFIPPPGSTMVWSPKIKDLGGQLLAGNVSLGRKELMPGLTQTTDGVMEKQMMKWAATYKSGWPSQFTTHELIFDCGHYYLLNIKSFLSKFTGKVNQAMLVNRGAASQGIDKLFSVKFNNYGSIAWYLRNTVPSYLDWFQKQYPRMT